MGTKKNKGNNFRKLDLAVLLITVILALYTTVLFTHTSLKVSNAIKETTEFYNENYNCEPKLMDQDIPGLSNFSFEKFKTQDPFKIPDK